MKSDKKIYIFALIVGLVIGMIVKFSAPFSLFNFGWAKVLKINELNYTGGAYGQLSGGQGSAGEACGN